jgi:hypothetical protein
MQTVLLDRKETAKVLLENLKHVYEKLPLKDQQAVKGIILQSGRS